MTIKKKLVSGESKAALHTKAVVFDRESVYIGSYNLDKRSSNINTEADLYVESPELAQHDCLFELRCSARKQLPGAVG